MSDDDEVNPCRWTSTNLVGLPAGLLGSTVFNAAPLALHIAGARECNSGLFALLGQCKDLSEAREVFVHYVEIAFGLHRPDDVEVATCGWVERRRWRCGWRSLLQGWGMDANGAAGAVLKGWVESRFGLVPLYHKAPLQRFPSPAWLSYLEDKLGSRYQSNAIYQQLDLLYEFGQWVLQRFGLTGADPRAQHVRLWRGTNHADDQRVASTLARRHCTMALNNVVSLSMSAQTAGCFGDQVLELDVPLVKLLVFPGLLPQPVLQGEQEVLALGGNYEVVLQHA